MTNTAKIDVGGKTYQVPKFGPKQLSVLQTPLSRLYDAILRRDIPMADYPPELIDDLADVVFMAVHRADPTVTREAFEEAPTDRRELVAAFIPIMVLAGGFVEAAAAPPAEAAPIAA